MLCSNLSFVNRAEIQSKQHQTMPRVLTTGITGHIIMQMIHLGHSIYFHRLINSLLATAVFCL